MSSGVSASSTIRVMGSPRPKAYGHALEAARGPEADQVVVPPRHCCVPDQ